MLSPNYGSQSSFSRFLARATCDVRKLLAVGEKSEALHQAIKPHTIHLPIGKGVDVIPSSKVIEKMEKVASDMFEARLDKEHTSVGYYVELDHMKPIFLDDFYLIAAKVKEVHESKVTFDITVSNEQTGEVYGKGVHSRAAIKAE